ncbi:MAG: hypothetical protein WCJ19_00480 [bacterium]
MKKISMPVKLKIQDEQVDVVLPLAFVFLGVVVSTTIILLILA